MSLVGLVVSILVIFVVTAVLLWLVNTFIPMQEPLKSAMNKVVVAVVVICVVLYLLSVFGLLPSMGTVRVPQVH